MQNTTGKQRVKAMLLQMKPHVREVAIKGLRTRYGLQKQSEPTKMEPGLSLDQDGDLMVKSESVAGLSGEERDKRIRLAAEQLSALGISEADIRALADRRGCDTIDAIDRAASFEAR